MNQEIRNKLRSVVTQCRRLLEDSVSQELEGKYGIFAKKDQVAADPNAKMTHLTEEEQAARKDILDHFGHIKARDFKPKEALDQLVREIAFTHLNRLCAYKMMEAREVYVGGQKFREAVSRGINSNGVKFYLADHPEEERLFNTGHQDAAYRHFLDWLGGLLSDEIGVLFNPNDPANRLYPKQNTLDEVLDLLNNGGIKPEETGLKEEWPKIWSQDETIGWVYQYFTPKELRDQARKESAAPRNSYELAFRNQFFTPRYVVEFLTDNTLGRIWYEMRKSDTKLKDQCRYMVRRPTEIFLKEAEQPPKDAAEGRDDLSQEELLKLPVHIPHRPKKDPRDLRILDPACGSGHFLLYCFDLLLTIYEEAYSDPEFASAFTNKTLDDFRREIPGLILTHNLHGIDIDLRASQIAALALWLRCQRAYQDIGLKKDRPKITRSNFVCAEPMPGEEQMLKEFVAQLGPKLLGQVVEIVFHKMNLAGEAGSLLQIEDDVRETVAAAKEQWIRETTLATDRLGQPLLFTQAAMDRIARSPEQSTLFDLADISDERFFEETENRVVDALRRYAEGAHRGYRLQWRLFAEDSVRGFAFLDLCHKRYDVVLMNPPFGEPTSEVREYILEKLPSGRNDIYAAMIVRCLGLLADSRPFLGTITSRSFLVGRDLRDFRKQVLHPDSPNIGILWDLGGGVLDGATVETAAYIVCVPNGDTMLYHDSRSVAPTFPSSAEWDTELLAKFRQLPDSQFIFGGAGDVLLADARGLSFMEMSDVTKGLSTEHDERFVRLHWEVDPSDIGTTWFRFTKGSDYSWWSSDVHLVVNRRDNGREMAEYAAQNSGNAARTRQSSKFYGLAAITYSRRSQKGFSARRLREGCCFGDKSGVIIPRSERREWLRILPIVLASEKYIHLIASQVKFGSYEIAAIKRLPWPTKNVLALSAKADEVFRLLDLIDAADETTALFVRPHNGHETCSRAMEQAIQLAQEALSTVGLALDRDVEANQRKIGTEKDGVLNGPIPIVSFAVGASFGRWDVRLPASDIRTVVDLFAPPPTCPPGVLQGRNGLPLETAPQGYPLAVREDGILVDDSEHPSDIVRCVRDALEVMYAERAGGIEAEACKVGGVRELREYFRRLGKGGFWDDHISRYSKSRRKAPIYWLLQSSKRNYALWLYYHRLDKDLLFKALVNYVEPKIRLETSRLEALRSQKTAVGESGKDAKRLAKEVERQEDFLCELRDFEDKLRRAADLHLEPDLNDGVVLNIAPLHELVPWKDAESYWEELLEGKYEWSSIGKQLRQKGLVK